MHEGPAVMVETLPAETRRTSRLAWFLVILLALLLVLAAGWIWQLSQTRSPGPPLSAAEERALEEKLDRLRIAAQSELPDTAPPGSAESALEPEVYREDPARRQLRFTEREINALIARDPALAGRAAVRLSPGQISASFLLDVPEEMPLLGGRRLRVQTGLRLATQEDRVEARLLGVSVGGIPLPNAWLGGLKGEDLLATSGLGALGSGIEALSVGEGWVDLLLAP